MQLPKYLPLKLSIGICMIVTSVMATSALYDDTGMGTTVTSGNQFTSNMWNVTVSNIRDIYSRTQYIGTSGGNTTLAGQLTAGSYIGNGSGITSLNPANISAGTAGINITGNAATATTATTAITANVLTTARTINNVPFNGSSNITIPDDTLHSNRDFADGTLITTNIAYNVTNGDPWVLEIKGNSYGSLIPFDIQYQGYIYSNTIINHGGVSNGTNITGLVALNYGGFLSFWYPRQAYWQGFNVKVYVPYAGNPANRVTAITDSIKPPAATKEVALSSEIRQSLHTGNFSSYAPSFTGVGASGTWGINITGNANSVGGLSIHSGRNNEANKIVRTDGSGYIQAGWINTLSGNMGDWGNGINKFYASNDDYVRYIDRNATKVQLGLTSKWDADRRDYTTDSNYFVGSMGWGTTDMNTVFDWGSGFFDTWSSPGNSPGDTSHYVGINAVHYTNGSTRYGWQLAGGPTSDPWYRQTWGGFGAWQKIMTSNNISSHARIFNSWQNNHYSGADGAEHATIFYDSNNSGYYSDPSNTTRINALIPNTIQPYGVGGDSGVGAQSYGIYQEGGAWTYPYPDLNVAWHTGIKIGGHSNYGGTRFYNDYPANGSEIFSVGNGDSNVRVVNNLYVGGNITAATPTAANHVTTKAYVDSAVSAAGSAALTTKCLRVAGDAAGKPYCSIVANTNWSNATCYYGTCPTFGTTSCPSGYTPITASNQCNNPNDYTNQAIEGFNTWNYPAIFYYLQSWGCPSGANFGYTVTICAKIVT